MIHESRGVAPIRIRQDASGVRSGKTRGTVAELEGKCLFLTPLTGKLKSDGALGWCFDRAGILGRFGQKTMKCRQRDHVDKCWLADDQKLWLEDRAFDRFWLPEWRECLDLEHPICPVRAADFLARDWPGTIVSSIQRYNMGDMEARVARMAREAKGRHVILDEYHSISSWDRSEYHQDIFSCFTRKQKASMRLPVGFELVPFFMPRRTPGEQAFDQWLWAETQAAWTLYVHRTSPLPDVQRWRRMLYRTRTWEESSGKLVSMATLRKRARNAVPELRRKHPDHRLTPIMNLLDKEAESGPVFAKLWLDRKQNTNVSFAAWDVDEVERGRRLLRLPRHSIMRAIKENATEITLLSATPPMPKQVTWMFQQPVEEMQRRPPPRVSFLLEARSRGQRKTSGSHSIEEGSPAKSLILPTVGSTGLLFLRNKWEAAQPVWQALPADRRGYCRGHRSKGFQSDSTHVVLAGPPKLPHTLTDACFIDPTDQEAEPHRDRRTAVAASQIIRSHGMLQELFQNAGRTARLDQRLEGRCIVFGCDPEVVDAVTNVDLMTDWCREMHEEHPNIAVMRVQKNTTYASRQAMARAFLDGLDLVQPHGKAGGATPGIAIEPDWAYALYWILDRADELLKASATHAPAGTVSIAAIEDLQEAEWEPYRGARRAPVRKVGRALVKALLANWVPRQIGSPDPLIYWHNGGSRFIGLSLGP